MARLRLAKVKDAEAILRIYAPFIEKTAITFEYEVPDLGSFAERVRRIGSRFPYLVAEEGGEVVGFAYAAEQHERAAYQWNATLSVYLAPESGGKGLGRALYSALIETLRRLGYKNLYGLVTLPNEKSMRLHASLGFSTLGVLEKSGYKLGRWHDVAWVAKSLGAHQPEPAPPKSILEVSPQEIQVILLGYSG